MESIAATPNLILPTFNAFIAILNPPFLSPKRFSAGITTSSRKTILVDEDFNPNLFSSAPKFNPLVPYSTINPVIFLSYSIRAKTINT